MLASHAWGGEQSADAARKGDNPCDYVVVTHLLAGNELWKAQLSLLRTIDGACLDTAEVPIDCAQPTEGVRQLAELALDLLAAGNRGEPASGRRWLLST